jgi:hypothetical protein
MDHNESMRKFECLRATDREAYRRQLALTKLFDDAGVRMMVGTDGCGQALGHSIHQEFDEIFKAGLSRSRFSR